LHQKTRHVSCHLLQVKLVLDCELKQLQAKLVFKS
jgi:hypothetical protein